MNNELSHYGVLGMKWGRRRSRTSSPGSEDHRRASALKKKRVHEMTNEELKAVSTRLQLETNYKNLNPSRIARGKKTVTSVVTTIGTFTAASAAIGTLIAAGKKIYSLAKKVK